jgi:hypothetical protein
MSNCNLEGKTVLYHMFDKKDELEGVDRSGNNHTNTCPAIVLTDWSPNTQNLTAKCLNLTVFPDCGDPFQASSAVHVEASGVYSEEIQGEKIEANAKCWQIY